RHEVEAGDQLGEVARHERGHGLVARRRCQRKTPVVRGDQLLLPRHAVVLDGRGGHAALQSFIVSANVPVCSRIGWNCPVFSAYLNAVHGMCSRSSASTSIGWSRSAGVQNEGAAKMTPSARAARTRSTRARPRPARAEYIVAVGTVCSTKARASDAKALRPRPGLTPTERVYQRDRSSRSSSTTAHPLASIVFRSPSGGCSQ